MENKIQTKDYSIDNLRALAILIVVLGHSIILYSHSWNLYTASNNVEFLDSLKSIINLIQMPLFFSISGYLYYYSHKHTNFLKLLTKKAKRLLVPYCMIAIFWMIPIKKIVGYAGFKNKTFIDIFINENGHLWFLPCLFLIFCFTYLLLQITNKLNVSEKISGLILIVVSYFCSYFFYLLPTFLGSEIIRSAFINWIWFSVGYIMHVYKNRVDIIKSKNIKWIIMIIGLLLSIFLIYNNRFSRITSIILVFLLYISIPNNTGKIMQFLSKNSFGLYLFHSPLIYLTFTYFSNASPVLVVGLNFAVFGLVAAVMTVLVRKLKLGFIIGEG